MNGLIAITGATGFAGGHAIAHLLSRGHRLRALVRNPKAASLPPEVEIVAGDLADPRALARLVEGTDAVVHLAAVLAAFDRDGYFRINAEGTRAIADAALKAGVSRFVQVSSLAAREPQLSSYAASKRAGEEIVRERAAALNAVILRPPAVYGPGDRGTLRLIKELTNPIALIPGLPDARFSLLHGRDLARLIALSLAEGGQGLHELGDGKAGGHDWPEMIATAQALRGAPIHPIFLPRGVPLAVATVAEGWARLNGKPGMVNRGKIAELYHPDWVAREGTLGLSDPIPFAAGLAETVAWYRAARWLPPGPVADRRGPSSRTSQ